MNRIKLGLLLILILISVSVEITAGQLNNKSRLISLPLDYTKPFAGRFSQFYQVNSDFNPDKPCILFVFDPQQPQIWESDELLRKYGFTVNLIYFQVRGFANSAIPSLVKDNCVQWKKARRVLDSRNIIRDMDEIRKDYLDHFNPTNRDIYMIGGSGGGFLCLQYLELFHRNIRKAFVMYPACSNQGQKFWNQVNLIRRLNQCHPDLVGWIEELTADPDRFRISSNGLAFILQRMGYTSLDYEHSVYELISRIMNCDLSMYEKELKKSGFERSTLFMDLRIDNKMLMDLFKNKFKAGSDCEALKMAANRFLPSVFRVYEMGAAGYINFPSKIKFDPDKSLVRSFAPHFMALHEQKEFLPVNLNPAVKLACSDVKTEIVLTGCEYDHVCPWQEIWKLGKSLENCRTIILRDNHKLILNRDWIERTARLFLSVNDVSDSRLREMINRVTENDITVSLDSYSKYGKIRKEMVEPLKTYAEKCFRNGKIIIDYKDSKFHALEGSNELYEIAEFLNNRLRDKDF